MEHTIWSIYGEDYGEMAQAVLAAADVAARIGAKDARIAIKPNLVVASGAEHGATTHVALVEGIIAWLRAQGFHNLSIMEGAWVGARTKDAFDVCGYTDLSRKLDVPLVDTQREPGRTVDCAGMALSVCECALDIDFLINVPVMKGHCQTNITCALKNMKGLIPDAEKRRFHTMGLHRPIAHLSAGIRQGFVLVDAICGDLSFEEGGNPVVRNQVFGCYDPVLCDAYVCAQLGYALEEVPYVGMAAALGIGTADLSQAEIIALRAPQTQPIGKASRRVQALARHVAERDACSACYANLIYALERLDGAGLLERLPGPVAVGQGYQGQAGGCGVGRCTGGFADSLAGCPPDAAAMHRFLLDVIAKSS